MLKNGASSENVFWAVSSSATLGYSSTFVGQILAKASINIYASVLLGGRALAKAAITFSSGALVDVTHTSATANVSIGACSPFGVNAGTTITFGTGQSVIHSGLIGASSTITGNYTLPINTVAQAGTTSAANCVSSSADAYNTASTASCQYYQAVAELSGLVLTPGVYCSAPGTFTIAQLAYTVLDGLNSTNSIWIFQTSTTLTTGADSSVILKNGARSRNIYWAIGSSVSLGYSSFIVGNSMA